MMDLSGDSLAFIVVDCKSSASVEDDEQLPLVSVAVQTSDSDEFRFTGKKVVLNIGGVRHETMWTTLERFPNTRLGQLSRCVSSESVGALCDDFNLDTMQFFFDRNPRAFSPVLHFYQTGKLHLAEDICVVAFTDELKYWGIDELHLEPCCQHRFYQRVENVAEDMRLEDEIVRYIGPVEDQFGSGKCAIWRQRIWDLLEKPHTSVAAKVVAVVSVLFIIASMIGLALSTLPEFHTKDEAGHETDHVHLAYLEAVCIGWFTLEYVARLIASPNLCRFLRGFLNCIDLIVILPYYLSLTFDLLSLKADQFHDVRRSLQTLRMFRIMRILKLVRHSTGLQSIGYTFKRSYKEFGLLLMFIVIGMMTFSTLVYFAEHNSSSSSSSSNTTKKNTNSKEPSDDFDGFDSIPSTMWWAVITMTTVGYGDVYPTTPWGKLVGAICSTSGILVIALPIPIIVSNFGEFYKEQKRRQKIMERRHGLDVLRQPDEFVPLTCTAERCSSERVETVSPVNGRSLRNSITP